MLWKSDETQQISNGFRWISIDLESVFELFPMVFEGFCSAVSLKLLCGAEVMAQKLMEDSMVEKKQAEKRLQNVDERCDQVIQARKRQGSRLRTGVLGAFSIFLVRFRGLEAGFPLGSE